MICDWDSHGHMRRQKQQARQVPFAILASYGQANDELANDHSLEREREKDIR